MDESATRRKIIASALYNVESPHASTLISDAFNGDAFNASLQGTIRLWRDTIRCTWLGMITYKGIDAIPCRRFSVFSISRFKHSPTNVNWIWPLGQYRNNARDFLYKWSQNILRHYNRAIGQGEIFCRVVSLYLVCNDCILFIYRFLWDFRL